MENIRDYIAKDSPFYARRFIERVFDHVEKLVDFAGIMTASIESGCIGCDPVGALPLMVNRRLTAKFCTGGRIMQPAKQEALNTIGQLPEDADMDEIMYRLYVVDKIRKGQQATEDGQTISHEELKKEIDQW